MSQLSAAGAISARNSGKGVFERFLTVWVALCIIAGIVLGQLMPAAFRAIGDATLLGTGSQSWALGGLLQFKRQDKGGLA